MEDTNEIFSNGFNFLVLMIPMTAFAIDTAKLSWDNPVDAEGIAMDIDGVQIGIGTTIDNYTLTYDAGMNTEVALSELPIQPNMKYYFIAKSYKTFEGRTEPDYSANSNSVIWVYDPLAPAGVENLRIVSSPAS